VTCNTESFDPATEFDAADLGDLRLNGRLVRVMRGIGAAPSSSLPEAFRDPSQLEGVYRLLANTRVTAEALLEGHRDKTVSRAQAAGSVIVIHDSSSFEFGGAHKMGMGVIDPGCGSGFYSHFSLCVSEGDGRMLGMGWMHLWKRTGASRGKRPQQESQYDPDRESLRWNEAVHASGDDLRLGGVENVVHVMDREGDCLELLSDMCEHTHHFVVRAKVNRRLEPGRLATQKKLFSAFEGCDVIATREVEVIRHKLRLVVCSSETGANSSLRASSKAAARTTGKGPNERKSLLGWSHQRLANLEIKATTVTIHGGNGCHAHVPADGLTLNAVEVREAGGELPAGAEPVQWLLLTTLPVDSPKAVERVVDIYRRRWLIEEFHKALKTGCRYEEHQFDSVDRYVKMLVLYVPVALQMLLMRWLERHEPTAPAALVVSVDELDALRAHEARRGKPLPDEPTVAEVFKVIARLGGHLSQNGPPGWLILSRGLQYLQGLTQGWELARMLHTPIPDRMVRICDQS
jgi:hypothetical protein